MFDVDALFESVYCNCCISAISFSFLLALTLSPSLSHGCCVCLARTWCLIHFFIFISLFLFVSMLFSTFPSFPLESLSVCVCMGVCISHPVERFHAPRILLGGCHACTCLDQAASCVEQFTRLDLMGLVRVECRLSSLVLLKKKGISDRWGRHSQIGFLCASIDASPSMKPV